MCFPFFRPLSAPTFFCILSSFCLLPHPQTIYPFLPPPKTTSLDIHTTTTKCMLTAHIDWRLVYRAIPSASLMDSLLPSSSHDLHSPAPSALTRALGLTQPSITFHVLCHALHCMSFDIAYEKPKGGCVGVGVGCERTVEDCEVSVRD